MQYTFITSDVKKWRASLRHFTCAGIFVYCPSVGEIGPCYLFTCPKVIKRKVVSKKKQVTWYDFSNGLICSPDTNVFVWLEKGTFNLLFFKIQHLADVLPCVSEIWINLRWCVVFVLGCLTKLDQKKCFKTGQKWPK